MIFCPACNHRPERPATSCSICGAPLADALALDPPAPPSVQRIRTARVLGAMLFGLMAILAYASIEKTGPAGPGVVCAVSALAAAVLMPS